MISLVPVILGTCIKHIYSTTRITSGEPLREGEGQLKLWESREVEGHVVHRKDRSEVMLHHLMISLVPVILGTCIKHIYSTTRITSGEPLREGEGQLKLWESRTDNRPGGLYVNNISRRATLLR